MDANGAERDNDGQGQERFTKSHHVHSSQAIRIMACVEHEEFAFYTSKSNPYQNIAFSYLITVDAQYVH